jgi:hypothetical protein
VYSRFAAVNNVCGYEVGQVAEPQAGCLAFAMAVLPRLNHLILPAADNLNRILVHDRVLNRDAGNVRVKEQLEEGRALFHVPPAARLCVQPADSAVCEVSTGGVRNEKVPPFSQHFACIALIVAFGGYRGLSG